MLGEGQRTPALTGKGRQPHQAQKLSARGKPCPLQGIRILEFSWFLASAGADGADLLGGMGVHHEMKRSQRVIGLGGAVIGIGVGLWGATRKRTVPARS